MKMSDIGKTDSAIFCKAALTEPTNRMMHPKDRPAGRRRIKRRFLPAFKLAIFIRVIGGEKLKTVGFENGRWALRSIVI